MGSYCKTVNTYRTIDLNRGDLNISYTLDGGFTFKQ